MFKKTNALNFNYSVGIKSLTINYCVNVVILDFQQVCRCLLLFENAI